MKTISRFIALMLLFVSGTLRAQSVIDSLQNEGFIPLITDDSQLSSPYSDPDEGSLDALIDNDPYTFWHSNWHSYSHEEPHYLQIELADLTAGDFILYMKRRDVSSDHPTRVRLDFYADSTFTDSVSFEVEMPQTGMTFHGSEVASEIMTAVQICSKYVRVTATQTSSSRVYWHAAELQLFCQPLVEDSTFKAEAEEYIASLEEYPALKEEVQTAYNEYLQLDSSATDDERLAAVAKFNAAKRNVEKALTAIESIAEIVAAVDTLADIAEYPELKAVQNTVMSMGSLKEKSSAEILQAQNLLDTEWAIYSAFHTNIDEWNFTGRVNIDGFTAYLDKQNQVARVYTGDSLPRTGNRCEIPMVYNSNGTIYPVVYVDGSWSEVSWKSGIEEFIVPRTVQSLGSCAFGFFKDLKELTLPAGLKKVHPEFISGSSRLRMVDFNCAPPVLDNALSLPNNFVYFRVPDSTLTDYLNHQYWGQARVIAKNAGTIEVTLTEQGDLGWHILLQEEDIRKVSRVIVKSGTLNNEDWVFLRSMRNLISVDLSACGNTIMPNDVFRDSRCLEVILPKALTRIGDNAFNGSSICSIVIPENVTSLGEACFIGCRNLDDVKILASLENIPTNCFNGCSSLDNITFPATLKSINGSAFGGCSSLDKITFPATLKSITSWAFSDCTSLSVINFNEGLEIIDYWAFNGCNSLREITLPSSLRSCTNTPFNNCHNLKSITLHSVIAPNAGSACPVSGVDLDEVTLYVPKISRIEYQLAGGWSSILDVVPTNYMPEDIVVSRDFTFRMEMDSTTVDYNPNFSLVWSSYNETGNLKVHTAGKLNANKFSMYYSPYAKYCYDERQVHNWGSSTQYNTTTLIVNGEMRAESTEIIMMNRNNQWQFVSFPFDVKMSDIVAQNDSTQWVIREYSGANRAEGLMDETWLNLDSTAVLKAGKGYIMHCFSTHEPVLFSVRPDVTSVTRQNIFMSEDIAMPLEKHESEFAHNMSWNLIGNPYPAFFDFNFTDFNAPITVWNSSNQNYVAMVPGDDNFILSPGESFFVQCPVDKDSITFSAEGRQKDLTIRDEVVQSRNAKAAQRSLLNLSIEGEGTVDRTRVVINEEAKMDYEMHCDASKFGAMDEKSVLLYTIQGNMHMAINERPLASGRVMMGVSIGETGDYTLTAQVPERMTVTLEDRATGKRVLLDGGQAYDFHATKGDYNNRFTLHISAAGETAIEKVEAEQMDEAPAYNVAGQRINAKDAKGVVIQDAKKVIK
ncbi:MAG: leucine-rich repeat protein [Bacteroidaceae bacterium]|nr:leucine-rich repeat protein [Bacteroidaceae bacterium]